MNRHGIYLQRIDRQRVCDHEMGPWQPYGNPEYELYRRECRICWHNECLSRQELEEDGAHIQATSTPTPHDTE